MGEFFKNYLLGFVYLPIWLFQMLQYIIPAILAGFVVHVVIDPVLGLSSPGDTFHDVVVGIVGLFVLSTIAAHDELPDA